MDGGPGGKLGGLRVERTHWARKKRRTAAGRIKTAGEPKKDMKLMVVVVVLVERASRQAVLGAIIRSYDVVKAES